ncbi:MAG: GNAT family N-acetyltransferase [Nitrospiria bacterium]
MRVTGKRIYLKLLSPDDVTPVYIDWMQDEAVIQFLESRWTVYGLDALKAYVKTLNEDPNAYLFGIFLLEDGRQIGNIKIGGIAPLHRFADIGLLIGEQSMRGQGIGTEAIQMATTYAFKELNLQKVVAGLYANNIGSHKAFLKAGWREAGRMKCHRFYKGGYVDEVLVEKLRD